MADTAQPNLGPMLRLVYVAVGVGIGGWGIVSANSIPLMVLGGAVIVCGLIAWCPVCAMLGLGKK
ncbi:MAG: DUF2892 domain-containing protein [Acidobacteria bacterium]|nr:DUF2892 domain-containing protein [Acidobacteriota bacterium]